MLSFRRLIAGVSIAAILLAVCLPGLVTLDSVWVEFGWVLLPDDVLVAASCAATPCDEQPAALLSLGAPRGPPSGSALQTGVRDAESPAGVGRAFRPAARRG
jgi:hypothetical protein